MNEQQVLSFSQKALEMTIEYLPKVALAIITLFVGLWVIKKLSRIIDGSLHKSNMDLSLSKFITSIASTLMKVMLLISVAGMFGVNTTSFIAVISALMIGIGMALNGTIGNVASGIMLMVFKPFEVGNLVTIGGGQTGTVEAINAFNTTLKTLDNKRIIISNNNVTGNDIINITGQGVVGVELSFGIGYSSNIDIARKIILDVAASCPHILNDPPHGVVVSNLSDNSVDLATRPFCNPENYWDVKFYMNEHVKKSFDKQGIEIPFPQLTLHR